VVTAHLQQAQAVDLPLQDVRLALTEAAAHVVMHAYDAPAAGDIRVRVDLVSDREVVIAIEDDGCGLKPRSDSPGLGMGLSLISTSAHRVEVCALPAGGTQVLMWFRGR
jgi:stage II sporulation protein AB (anti-sigma F factor)